MAGTGGALPVWSFSITVGNSDMGLSSEGGRALKLGSLRLARISAA